MRAASLHLTAVLVALLTAFVLRVPAAHCAPARADAGTITVGLTLEPPTLDPTSGAAAAIKEVAFQTVFEGLVKLGPGGRVSPLLATHWSVSPDGLVYTFQLRPGVQFQDGSVFDAAAVKFTLDRARAETSTNSQKPRFQRIAEVTVLNPLTVQIRLKQRYSSFLQVLGWGDAVIVSPRSAATEGLNPIGTGPFRFVRWRRGYAIELDRNPTYWGAAPRFAHVVFRFINDPNAATAALYAGDVDIFPAFPAPESIARLRRDPRFAVDVGPSEAEVIVALNHRIAPLNDLRVRRALSYAIDRQGIIQGAMFGLGQPIGSHYPPQNPGYVDLTGLYPHDPAKARALLAEAGYPHGFDLTLSLPPPSYARRSGEIVAAQLAEVGVRVKIVDLEWAQWLAQVFGRHAFDMTIVSHVEPMDYDIYARHDYYFGYNSPAFDATLHAFDDATDPARRTALIGDVQRKIAGDAVNLFLFEYPALGVRNVRVRNIWAPTPVSVLDLSKAWLAGGPTGAAQGRGGAPAWLWVVLGAPFVLIFGVCALRSPAAYLVERLGGLALTLLAGSLLIFLLIQIAPGDPARNMMGMSADPAALATLRHQLGLDAPAWRRYLTWIFGAIRGDFGLSYTYRVPVGPLIVERLAVSLPLTLYALILSTSLAVVGGVWAAAQPRSVMAKILDAFGQIGLAVPNFWLGMILVIVFATGLKWASAGGFPGWSGGVGPALKALTLPAIALAAPQAAVLMRVLRGELLSAMETDYIRTARARGLSRTQALIRHALRNALAPTLTILGLQFSFLLAGAVIIETVFSLPGLGQLLLQSVMQRDLVVVQNVVLLLVLAVTLTTFLIDLVGAAVDPRLGEGRAK